MPYDITIWEAIRAAMRQQTEAFRCRIERAILNDVALSEFRSDPVPWQIVEILRQRADSWVTELYKICCDVQRSQGGGITAEFDRAIWAYCIEPFIMGPPTPYGDSPRTSELLELLLCALGSPPERRMSLKVSQKNCCLDIRNKVLETWWRKLHHLPHNAPLFGLPRPVLTPRTYTGGRLGVNSPGYSSSSVPRPLEETKQPTQVPLTTSPPLTASLASPSMPVFRASAGHVVLRWEDIEILFLSDHRVQISRLGVKAEPVNYADFGFADGRNENPNLAWQTLRILAEQEGILSNEKEANARWADVEKRIQEVRKVLRSYFQISSDPILFVKDRGYVAQFRIRCSKSYRH